MSRPHPETSPTETDPGADGTTETDAPNEDTKKKTEPKGNGLSAEAAESGGSDTKHDPDTKTGLHAHPKAGAQRANGGGGSDTGGGGGTKTGLGAETIRPARKSPDPPPDPETPPKTGLGGERNG